MPGKQPAVEVETRVRFPETDRYDTVHHSHAFTWFEMARIEYLRACGLTIADFDTAGVFIVVRECSARFLGPMRYDDGTDFNEVGVVRARLVELTPIKIGFEYEIASKNDGRVLATGTTLNVPVGRGSVAEAVPPGTAVNASGKITRLPARLLDAMRAREK